MRIPILESLEVLAQSDYATVWRGKDGWVYKRSSLEFFINEYLMLRLLENSGYVPRVEMVEIGLLAIEDLGDQLASWSSVTDRDEFMFHALRVLSALRRAGIRHGDLTEYAIIVQENRPMLIDFAESRRMHDSRPDKRPEGDEYWLNKSMEKICKMSGVGNGL